MNNTKCNDCQNTGLLVAFLVKNPENNEKKIVVKLCKGHYNHSFAEHTLEAMKKNTDLPVEIG